MPDTPIPIVLAGGTGDLGLRIAAALRERGALVVALVRAEASPAKTQPLRKLGVTLAPVDFADAGALAAACAGAGCVVSALSGLGETIVGAQGALLEAAVRAGVPRFIPSDYSIDFRPLPPGSNRNFDLRRDFHARLEAAPIRATSIFNGAFADLLAGQAPIVLFGLHRVLYWESADQPLDFTTKDDVAAFTAEAALDPMTPRALHVAGTRTSARGLAEVMSRLGDRPYTLLRAGGLGRLAAFIRIARAVAPGKGQVFPPWQGMQYLHNMFDPTLPLWPLDNDRYETPGRWTGVEEVLREALDWRPGGRHNRTRRPLHARTRPMTDPIRWPDRYAPARTAVHVSNTILVTAPPSVVWAILTRAVDWPAWYPNSRAVAIEGGGTDLSLGARFTWRTFGVRVRSTVREFVPHARIAWDGAGLGLDIYHAWLIEPTAEGCRVLTEENQNGLGARAMALVAPNRMHAGHQLWLERLKARAEARAR